MTDLSLVPIEDIYAELNKRFDVHVFLARRPQSGWKMIEVQTSGDQIAVLGMLEFFTNKLKNS